MHGDRSACKHTCLIRRSVLLSTELSMGTRAVQGAEANQVRPHLRTVLGVVLRRHRLSERTPAAAAQRVRGHLHVAALLTAPFKGLCAVKWSHRTAW